MTDNNEKTQYKYHVSVTGMDIHSIWQVPKFMGFASRSMKQAKESEGAIKVQGGYRKGVHHTLTIWQDKESMQQYMRSGAHKQAMAESKNIGSFVKVYGYDTNEIPTMDEALQLWETKGRLVYKMGSKAKAARNHSVMSTFLLGCGCFLVAAFALTNALPPSADNLLA